MIIKLANNAQPQMQHNASLAGAVTSPSLVELAVSLDFFSPIFWVFKTKFIKNRYNIELTSRFSLIVRVEINNYFVDKTALSIDWFK